MNVKKDIILSCIGLFITVLGSVVLWLIKFPAGIFIVIPTSFPHIYRLISLKKKK